jgi:hypothetical protein
LDPEGPASLFRPIRAIEFRKGISINVNGHTPMQKMYILAISKVRSRVGIKNSCNMAKMADDKAKV